MGGQRTVPNAGDHIVALLEDGRGLLGGGGRRGEGRQGDLELPERRAFDGQDAQDKDQHRQHGGGQQLCFFHSL